MNLTETLAGIAVTAVFLVALCALVRPLMRSLEGSRESFERARSIEFLDASFRSECAASDPDIEGWKRDVAAVSGLESCVVVPRLSRGVVRAMDAVCVVGSVRVEILAECAHE